MFKCEVINIVYYKALQETVVFFKLSNIGISSTKNHQLIDKHDNNHFYIGEIDKSIKVGDLIRCDGLPFTSRPAWIKWEYTHIHGRYRNGLCKVQKEMYPGYKPFQLDSGYWVLRKYEHSSKKEKITSK